MKTILSILTAMILTGVAFTTSAQESGWYIVTSSSVVDMHNGPSEETTVVGSLDDGERVYVFGHENKWAKVQFGTGNRIAYVDSSKLEYDPAPPSEETSTPGDYRERLFWKYMVNGKDAWGVLTHWTMKKLALVTAIIVFIAILLMFALGKVIGGAGFPLYGMVVSAVVAGTLNGYFTMPIVSTFLLIVGALFFTVILFRRARSKGVALLLFIPALAVAFVVFRFVTLFFDGTNWAWGFLIGGGVCLLGLYSLFGPHNQPKPANRNPDGIEWEGVSLENYERQKRTGGGHAKEDRAPKDERPPQNDREERELRRRKEQEKERERRKKEEIDRLKSDTDREIYRLDSEIRSLESDIDRLVSDAEDENWRAEDADDPSDADMHLREARNALDKADRLQDKIRNLKEEKRLLESKRPK